jgi:2-keto-4-pentenoate hydratase/2-oxohepta-3-ene-1,7-dioic acid hydratase in catechol pathway
MKIASFKHGAWRGYAAVVEDGLIDLTPRLGNRYANLRALLEAGALQEAATALKGARPDLALTDIEWLPLIPNPDKIICVGLNYQAHIREIGRDVGNKPTLFLRLAASQVGHLQPMLRPKISDKFDYEGELAVVIGKTGRYIEAGRALDHVAGYSIYNDGSVRDWQRHTQQYTPGKNFPATGSFGPCLVTADEVPDVTKLTLQTRLNGILMQEGRLDDLMFPIDFLISYISQFTALVPGDVIVTGTPGGVGDARKPPVYMKPGDTIEVAISSIGILQNPVAQDS